MILASYTDMKGKLRWSLCGVLTVTTDNGVGTRWTGNNHIWVPKSRSFDLCFTSMLLGDLGASLALGVFICKVVIWYLIVELSNNRSECVGTVHSPGKSCSVTDELGKESKQPCLPKLPTLEFRNRDKTRLAHKTLFL